MILAELGECASTLETADGCSVLDALGKLEGGEMEEPASMQGSGEPHLALQEWMCCSLALHLQGAFSDTMAVSRPFPDFSEKLSSDHARIFP